MLMHEPQELKLSIYTVSNNSRKRNANSKCAVCLQQSARALSHTSIMTIMTIDAGARTTKSHNRFEHTDQLESTSSVHPRLCWRGGHYREQSWAKSLKNTDELLHSR